jgi:hypothetical protein
VSETVDRATTVADLRACAQRVRTVGLYKGNWVDHDLAARERKPLNTCPACAGGTIALVISGGMDFSPTWLQGGEQQARRHAIVEALLDVSPLWLQEDEDMPSAEHLRAFHDMDTLGHVADWNDREATTAEKVAGLFDAAADHLEGVPASA